MCVCLPLSCVCGCLSVFVCLSQDVSVCLTLLVYISLPQCVCVCVCVRTINYKLLLPLSLRCGGVYISSLWVLIGFWLFWTMERSRGMLGDFWGWSGKLWRFYPVLLKTDSGKRCCCSVAKSYLTLQTPWTTACQASLFFTISQSLLKFKSIESVMPSNHFALHHPLLLLP